MRTACLGILAKISICFLKGTPEGGGGGGYIYTHCLLSLVLSCKVTSCKDTFFFLTNTQQMQIMSVFGLAGGLLFRENILACICN